MGAADEFGSDGNPSRSDHGEGNGKAVGFRRGKVLDGEGGTDRDVAEGETGVAGWTEGGTGVEGEANGICSSMKGFRFGGRLCLAGLADMGPERSEGCILFVGRGGNCGAKSSEGLEACRTEE